MNMAEFRQQDYLNLTRSRLVKFSKLIRVTSINQTGSVRLVKLNQSECGDKSPY